MRASYQQIAYLVSLVKDVPGDFVEMGVWLGHTFVGLAAAARAGGRQCHAIDTFHGMRRPDAKDYDTDGRCAYAEGQFDVGGSAAFRKAMAPFGSTVLIWEGAVPDILEAVGNVVLAFSHLDMDHYRPTRFGLPWAWDHTSPGGIVCCHDWMASRDFLTPAAIKEWMQAAGVELSGTLPHGYCWFRKGAENVHP